MKFRLIVCILALNLVLSCKPSSTLPQADYQQPLATNQITPQVPEWNPREEGIGDLTERPLVGELRELEFRKKLEIVGDFYTPEQFALYVKSRVVPVLRQRRHWRPQFIVLHHTGIPKIVQRPRGFTRTHLEDLAYYYGVTQGWASGPHLFVDQNGIWVFWPLIKPGGHSPSWNEVSWGIEQLGDFNTEQYDTGPGARIRDNAIAALTILTIAADLDIGTLHFHKEDPVTTHKWCPGDHCLKSWVIAEVRSKTETWRGIWNSLPPEVGQNSSSPRSHGR